MPRRFAFAAVPVAFLALLAAGCGGSSSSSSSDTTPTDEWASSVCTAVSDWTDSLSSSVDTLKNGDLSKDAVQGVADEAKSSTETLIDDLKGLGKPDTAAGAEAQDTLNSLADDLQQDVDQISSAVDGSRNTLSMVTTVSSTLVTMGNQLSATFTKLQNLDAKGELEDAFNSADSCSKLTQVSWPSSGRRMRLSRHGSSGREIPLLLGRQGQDQQQRAERLLLRTDFERDADDRERRRSFGIGGDGCRPRHQTAC